MAGRVPDAQFGGNPAHAINQFRKVDRRAVFRYGVRVHVLAEQRHLAVSVRRQVLAFLQHRLHRPTAFAAPGEGDHAEGAHVVAPAHDRNEGAHAVRIVPHGKNVGIRLLAGEQHVDGRLSALARLVEQTGDVAVGVGPDHEIDKFLLFEQLVAQPLGHAAQHAEGESRLEAALAGAQFLEPAAHFLLGVLADGARIEQYDVGGFFVVRQAVAGRPQDRGHDFGIRDVHLAAVRLEKYEPSARRLVAGETRGVQILEDGYVDLGLQFGVRIVWGPIRTALCAAGSLGG